MRKSVKTLVLSGSLILGSATAAALYAQESPSPGSSMMDPNMRSMMSRMMENCSKMMLSMMSEPGARKPHEQPGGARPPK
jgi:hypothetical protein